MITLYHGSFQPMTPDNGRWGIYLTPHISVANDYIVSQANNATGSYGHIYSIQVDASKLAFTDDIDQLQRHEGYVLYCIDDNYFRIDDPESYEWHELSDEEIDLLLN
jgi:hypothetical protein